MFKNRSNTDVQQHLTRKPDISTASESACLVLSVEDVKLCHLGRGDVRAADSGLSFLPSRLLSEGSSSCAPQNSSQSPQRIAK